MPTHQKQFQKMRTKNTKNATGVQMVEVDQSKFAIEVINGEVRANLTQMAKPFGDAKKPGNWLKTEQAREYLNALCACKSSGNPVATKVATADLVQVKNGGIPSEQGTWAYDHNVVVEFARWLNPMFSVQVNELVWGLLTGAASASERPEPTTGYSHLLELVDRAALVLGTQARLASRLGFSSSVFSHLRTMPWLLSDDRKAQIEAFCKKVISEGAAYVSDKRGGLNMVRILAGVARIENSELRNSLLDELTGGEAA